MAALAENIIAALNANAGVQAAFGVVAAPCPIYINRAPDSKALPFGVAQEIIGIINATQNDLGQFADSLWQFSIYAASYAAANAIRKAIMAAFIALDATGLAGGEKFTLENTRSLFEPNTDAHHLILEVRFFSDPSA